MPLVPTFKFLLTEPIKLEREGIEDGKTASGIFISEKAVAQVREDLAVTKAKVLAVGPEVTNFKEGDIVYYNYFSGNTLHILGKDLQGKEDTQQHLVYEQDIVGVEK